MHNSKILAIIPARGGSKGVKKKNIRLLGDKPLIVWSIDEAKKSHYIGRLVVSTEDHEIGDICQKENVEVIQRPDKLAGDNSPTIDTVLHTLEVLGVEGYKPDYVILLQCTTPFRTVEDIDRAIESFIKNKERFESLVSVECEEYPPYWLKKIGEAGEIIDFLSYDKTKYTRRQDFETVYKLNGAIYIGTPENIIKNKGFESKYSLAFEMESDHSIDIDTEEDLLYAQYLVERKNKS